MKSNIRYKHAVLTKLVLITGLLFIALWLACFPSRSATPAALSEPKISVAEIYSRLVEERKIPWSEPTPLPGNTQEDRLLW